jgi:hypothetical protein
MIAIAADGRGFFFQPFPERVYFLNAEPPEAFIFTEFFINGEGLFISRYAALCSAACVP